MKNTNDNAGLPEHSVSYRLRVIQGLLKIRSVAAFANEIGVDTSVLNNIMSPYGRLGKPSFDTLQKIAGKFPRINMDWLITGNGEPLRPFGGNSSLPGQAPQHSSEGKQQEAGQNQSGNVNFIQQDKSFAELMHELPALKSELRVCQAEKENLERILTLKDEIIEILRKQNSPAER